MKKIEDLLKKFKSVGLTEHTIKDNLIEILKEELNIELTRKQIDMKNNRIIFKISGPAKTSIILKKNKLLEKLNKDIEELNIKIMDLV